MRMMLWDDKVIIKTTGKLRLVKYFTIFALHWDDLPKAFLSWEGQSNAKQKM